MLRLSLKGFGARKLRVALTMVAVALGVALISGTYVLTDTIDKSFDEIFQTAAKGTDVSITAEDAVEGEQQEDTATTIPASFLRDVERVPGVEKASGQIFSTGALLDDQGERLGAKGPPTFISSNAPAPFDVYDFVAGKAPDGPGQAALLKATADRSDVKLGDTVQVIGDGGRERLEVVGLADFGGGSSFGSATVAIMTLEEAQRLTGKVGEFDDISVAAKPGVTPVRLRNEIRRIAPATVAVRTGQENADKQSSDLRDQLGFLRTALLAFAGISLFVGAFIIFNTFSITVAQRMREFALLRTLGASRGQIMRSVLFEGLLIGAVGAGIGLLLGLLLAPGLRALFKSFGAELPSAGNVVEPRTIVVSLAVGIVVTLLSGLAPAIRATRVPPVAALREGAILPAGRGRRFVTPGGALLLLLGIAGLAAGLFGGAGIELVGLGAVLVFLGVALLSPRLVPPLASFVGGPLPGIVGRLARENAMRQPGRTAVTASALMIGVTLVAFVSIFAAGAKATIESAVDTAAAPGTLIVQNTDGFTPLPPQVAQGLAHVPGVEAVSPIQFSTGRVEGAGKSSFTSVNPTTLPEVFRTQWKDGSDATWRSLGDDGAVLTKDYADEHDLSVGDRLQVLTPTRKRVSLAVKGITDDNSGVFADVTISDVLARTRFGERQDAIVFAGVDPVNQKRVKAVVDRLLEQAYPVAEALTVDEFKDKQAAQITQLLALIYVLLSLAVIVSLFGIVNTLVLSIYERTRELGILRAIGTSRRQVRRMIRYEAVITSLIGAVIGIVLGVLFAIAIAQPLKDDGFQLSIPVIQLIVLVVLGAIAGVLAAIAPARRASRLDVLDALAYE
jgi:putative ABC transport system permease protein